MHERIFGLSGDLKTDLKLFLKQVFGFSQFRGKQQEIVQTVAMGNSALVLMPTGGGKSVCYQLPSLYRKGTGLVLSPLISLMEDQVQALRRKGVKAFMLNSFLGVKETRKVKEQLIKGEIDILYTSPERFVSKEFQLLLESVKLSVIAVDEAHCLSQWGHDFRPEYLQMAHLIRERNDVPCLALTATADHITRREIIKELGLQGGRVFLSSFDRNNLSIEMRPKENVKYQVLEFLEENYCGNVGIIYCSSRKKVDNLSQWLREQGINALPYHAGLSQQIRKSNQETFLKADELVIVATIAFGMGIDRADVRYVLHADLPKSIESYYQEIGRAGRDQMPAKALLLASAQDVAIWKFTISKSAGDVQRMKFEMRKVDHMYALYLSTGCKRAKILSYFEEANFENCNNCSGCFDEAESLPFNRETLNLFSDLLKRGHLFSRTQALRLLGKQVKNTKELIKGERSVRRVFDQLLIRGFFQEDEVGMLKLGKNSGHFLKGKMKSELPTSLCR